MSNKAAKQRGATGGGGGQNGTAAADRQQPPPPPKKQHPKATEVWAHNLEEEMTNLRDTAETYQHVVAEVLMPKVVASPTGPFGDYSEYNYQMLRCNVDLTRALQITLTLSDAKGSRPKGTSSWRFNFVYNPNKDFILQETLDQLARTCGVDLGKHHSQGIQAAEFGEQLMSSGLVLSEEVKWICFIGTSSLADKPPMGTPAKPAEPPERRFYGLYNFGYLLQLLTAQEMPDAVEGFRDLLDLYFPCRGDISGFTNELPGLLSKDAADPLKRPSFCCAQNLLDGFFRLPEALRSRAFDKHVAEAKPEESVALSGNTKRSHRRRHRGSDEKKDGVTKTNGAGAPEAPGGA